MHFLIAIAGHCSQDLLRAGQVDFDGGDRAVHGGGDIAIEQLFAEGEQIRFALLKRQGTQSSHEGDVGGADLAAVGDERVLLGFGLVLLSAARDEHGEVIEPALRLGRVAQALNVMQGVVDDKADDAMADVFAPRQAIGDAADAGVD